MSNLGVGFALRCFQRLSLPYIATRQFTWWQSRQTRGMFSPVLSSIHHVLLRAQTISSPLRPREVGCRHFIVAQKPLSGHSAKPMTKSLRGQTKYYLVDFPRYCPILIYKRKRTDIHKE